jgi:hypothetical protein
MIKTVIVLATLLASPYVSAACSTDQPELGDIGPSAELVCQGALAALPRGRAGGREPLIHSPTAVSVEASVDGKPISLSYVLAGFRWRLDAPEALTVGVSVGRLVLPVTGQ